jgi:hypothetical protein
VTAIIADSVQKYNIRFGQRVASVCLARHLGLFVRGAVGWLA